MSEPNGYLIHGTAFSSKEVAFKALVSNHEQESWFHKIWDEDAQPYYFEPKPQLTIPKSIAKLIDTGDTKYIRWAYADELIVCSDLAEDEWKAHEKREDEIVRRKALIQAYLAGKVLGVDLVKVVADD